MARRVREETYLTHDQADELSEVADNKSAWIRDAIIEKMEREASNDVAE